MLMIVLCGWLLSAHSAVGQQMPSHSPAPSQDAVSQQQQPDEWAERSRDAQNARQYQQTPSDNSASAMEVGESESGSDSDGTKHPKSDYEYEERWRHFYSDINITDVCLVLFTAVLTVAIIFLAIYTSRLWRTTIDLWKAGEKQIAVAGRAAEAAETAAKATAAAAEVARKEFISSHRPRIIVDRVASVVNGMGESGLARLQVIYNIINAGQTYAHIVAQGNTLFRYPSTTLPVGQWYDMHPDDHTLPSGSAMQATAASFYGDSLDTPLHPGNMEEMIFFMGCIRYRDDLGTDRVTAFLRIYDPATERFIVSDDSYYEYAY
jgi:hypothetical protein